MHRPRVSARLYAQAQTSGGLCYFLHDHLGYPVPSPALLKPRHDRFVAAVQAFAATQRLEGITRESPKRTTDRKNPS